MISLPQVQYIIELDQYRITNEYKGKVYVINTSKEGISEGFSQIINVIQMEMEKEEMIKREREIERKKEFAKKSFYGKSIVDLILVAKLKSIKFAINHPIEYMKCMSKYLNKYFK